MAVACRDRGGVTTAVVDMWQTPVLLRVALELVSPQKLQRTEVDRTPRRDDSDTNDGRRLLNLVAAVSN